MPTDHPDYRGMDPVTAEEATAGAERPAHLYTPAEAIQDPEAFKGLMARMGMGIDTHVTTDHTGQNIIALDRAGMEQLRDWFAAHGDAAQADAIQEALADHPVYRPEWRP